MARGARKKTDKWQYWPLFIIVQTAPGFRVTPARSPGPILGLIAKDETTKQDTALHSRITGNALNPQTFSIRLMGTTPAHCLSYPALVAVK